MGFKIGVMIKKKNGLKYFSGFTIVELLIATAVFSGVLLVAMVGFLQIGRLFYKGVTITQTQNTAQQIVNELTSGIQSSASSNNIKATLPSSVTSNYTGYVYACVNGFRYTYGVVSGKPIIYDQSLAANYSATSSGNFGLVRDKLSGSSSCDLPSVTPVGSASPIELLGSRMMVANLKVQSASSTLKDLYTVSETIAYGTYSVLNLSVNSLPYASCLSGLSSAQFCAVSTLSTSVYRGLHP